MEERRRRRRRRRQKTKKKKKKGNEQKCKQLVNKTPRRFSFLIKLIVYVSHQLLMFWRRPQKGYCNPLDFLPQHAPSRLQLSADFSQRIQFQRYWSTWSHDQTRFLSQKFDNQAMAWWCKRAVDAMWYGDSQHQGCTWEVVENMGHLK